MTGLRVALVDERDLFSEVLALALHVHDHRVTRIRASGPDRAAEPLVQAVRACRPEVAVLDIDLGSPDAPVHVVEELSRSGIKVVVVTSSADRARWGECLHRGARRVLPKTGELRDVVSTLRRIELRLPVMPREQRKALVDLWRREQVRV